MSTHNSIRYKGAVYTVAALSSSDFKDGEEVWFEENGKKLRGNISYRKHDKAVVSVMDFSGKGTGGKYFVPYSALHKGK